MALSHACRKSGQSVPEGRSHPISPASTGGCHSTPHERPPPMASTAALGGRDCGGNKSGNTQSNDISGGKGGAPGGSLVVPSGTASTGRGSGGGMLVDGRGGSGGSRNGSGGSTMPASGKEWESDMDACCRKICTILKEDCKVSRGGRSERLCACVC